MTTAWSQPYRLMIILMIVVGILTGCASVLQNLDDKMHRKRFKSDYETLENALSVYDDGDFEMALAQFKGLSTASASKKIARKAWLGEICCHLMLANTQAEYTAAIGRWHDFGKSAPENDNAWDLLLLDPLIVRMTPKSTTRVIEIHPPAEQIPAETATPADRQQDDRQLQAELAALKKKAQHAARLQRRMDEVVAENRSLKEKIKALEAIDQSIQKKKTEISAPSE
ncbi:MAG: hypothetical protein HGJ94_03315 [Desulfosarcina sp.]|nr:hypothetical protein [Desulfosarcina sp.]MBC2743212.1 hypothetical protein [Desulfosarcina sp.]MBC2766123.1 hypothetical protein [Desulfosarcina sp.]